MITRAGLADEIDGFDLQIKALNDAKSAGYKAYREQLEDAGMEPRRAAAEVAATKAAIVKRRKLRENPDDAREKDDLIDAILMEIMDRPSRAREASQSYAEAKGVLIASAEKTARDTMARFPNIMNALQASETGEITDTQEQPEEPATKSLGPGDDGDSPSNGAVLLSTPQGAGMERGIDQGVTTGETAPISHSAVTPPAADKTGAASLPSSAAPIAISDNDIPEFLKSRVA